MTIDDLKIAFAISQNQLEKFLDGFTAEQANQPAVKDGNPVSWILGHILSERVEAVELTGAEIKEGGPDLSMYVTGTQPDIEKSWPFEDLKAMVPATFEMIIGCLDAMNEEDLEVVQPNTLLGGKHDLGKHLFTYSLHEMYHIGQISLARRVLGLANM